MIEFKLNGKPFKMPTSWDDVKYYQYLKTFDITKDTTTSELISIFTDIDVETIKGAKVIVGLEKVLGAMTFANKPMQTTGYCEKVGKYKLPINSTKKQFDIQLESLAQIEDMKAIMKTLTDLKSIAYSFPKFVAIYLQKIRDGEYSYSKAVEMEQEVLNMPAKEVVITGGFFYLKLTSLLNGTSPTSRPTNQNPKNSTRGSRKSVKRSARR
jgi:hypothetical protein